jgi:glycine cleavage system H protein
MSVLVAKTFQLESVKAASDLVAPVSGSIIEVNSRLEDEPEIVTEDSMGEGWFIKVKLSNPEELNDLMDEDAYNTFIEE